MAPSQVIEGTWEEVTRHAAILAGKHVRLVIIGNGDDGAGMPFYITATAEERARAWEEWCRMPRPQAPPLSDEAISRETIYSPEQE